MKCNLVQTAFPSLYSRIVSDRQLNVNIGGGAGTAALRKTSWRRNLLKCDERHDSTSKSYKRQFSNDANVELQNCAIVS